MVLSIVLLLEEATDATVHYVERAGGKPPVIGTLGVERWALPERVPSELRVTLEFRSETRAAGGVTHAPMSERAASKASLSTGHKVTIAKNTIAGAKYPPEWLAQYLGKTGVVLWTTHDGAMVQLVGGATWFPYTELKADE